MTLLRSLLLFVLVLLPTALVAATEIGPPLGKLPDAAEPLHYALDFTLDPAATGYSGTARIRIRLNQAASRLWLHGRSLKVQQASLIDAQGQRLAVQYRQENGDGLARVEFGRSLPAQQIELTLVFSAAFNHQLEGVYQVKVGDEPYLVTQMEPVNARDAFPGFDEPRFKTPFDIRLTVPRTQAAFANTRQIAEQPAADGRSKTLSFATTLPLPTYLVAFAVGPWDVVDAPPVPPNPVRSTALPLRAIATRGNGARLRYVLQQTPAIVAFYEQYTGQAYPYDKLDLLGAPDFGAGAMENAGLIIFRDTLLLLDANSPAERYRAAFTTIAHEVAHQWFGDLVTAPWWDDIWLNEAFATWAEGKATAALQPDFHADMVHLEARLDAMQSDSLASARRIRQPIAAQGDIVNGFDGITYQKGASVIGMFEGWLGETVFREGIRTYLAAHRLRSGSSSDVIDAVAAASDQGDRLKQALRSFLDQPGTPTIRVELDCSAGKASLALSQSRFLPLGSTAESSARWGVPVCVRLGHGDSSGTQCTLLDTPASTLTLSDPTCPDWVMPNADGRGYYRFSVTPAAFAALAAHLPRLSGPEQLVFADAVISAFRRGELDPAALLEQLPALAASTVPQVAGALLDEIEWIREYLAEPAERDRFDARITAILEPRLQQLGYQRKTGEPSNDTALRARLAKFLALRAHAPQVRAALLAQGRAALGLDGTPKVDLTRANPDLLGPALAVAVQQEGAAAVVAIHTELLVNHDAVSRYAMLAALGASHDPAAATAAREYALTPAVQSSEMRVLFAAQNDEPENRAAFWHWYPAHFAQVQQRSPGFSQGGMPRSVSAGRCSADAAQELDAFFQPHLAQLQGGARGLAQARETIMLCAALRARQQGPALSLWLNQKAS